MRDANGDSDLAKLLQVQQAMKPYTRPSSGQVMLAIGVRFTTFKLLNSFALLVASFGKPLKLDLLISSRLQVPALPPDSKPIPPIAQIGIDLRGTWIPEEGSMMIEGRITEGSWFLDSACRLSGGAAFASWTKGKHNGDFVMTVGGYHPKFPVPAHYPQVPRLAFNITRSPIEIKGDAYFAMTPSALMAGGNLSATYTEDRIKAWFNCSADFLVAWEPFHYEATMQVEVGASYRTNLGTIRASVGARLQLWGPDLAGIATIDLKVIKYDVKFGNQNKTPPKPIDATTFRQRFLPANNADLISIGVSKGLVKSDTHKGIPLFVVNPADFALAIESVIPQPDGKNIGIGSMGKMALPAGEVLTWTIDKDQSQFKSEAIIKPVPAALWGKAEAAGKVRSPNFSANDTVIDAIVGYAIVPKDETTVKGSSYYPIDRFLFNKDTWEDKLKIVEQDDQTREGSNYSGGRENPNWPIAASYKLENLTTESLLSEVTNVLIGISEKSLGSLLTALTGQEHHDEFSISTDWLADLQELPRIVILEQ